MADLAGLFASVGEDVNGTRSAPLRLLPELIDKFELLRGITLLGPDEKDAMRAFALANPDQSIGPDDLSMLLGMVNLPSTGTTLTSDPPTPPSPSPSRLSSAPSLSSDPFLDPAPSRRPRTLSSRSSTPTSNNPSRIPSPSTPSPSSSTNSSPSKTNANASKRTSFLSRLKSSSSSTLSRRSSIGGGGGGGEKEKDRTDLSDLARGHSYLGVELDGPLGEDFDATEEADKLRAATKGVGTRESIVIEILADKTFPQLRAIESVYVEKYDKTLAELIASEGALKSNLGKVLRGLVLGPLGFDVDLLIRATDTAIKPNEHLLTELLVSRPPSELSLLRTAFARRLDPTSSSRSSTTLNDAVLRSFAGNARLRKVWEIVLAGKWDDEGASVGEDVDQLRVALRARPANLDVVTKILFARSPDRIHAIVTEFKKPAASTGGASKGSLTKAIKLAVPVGQLRSMLLFAVEGAKNDQDGVWRDSKLLMASMEGVGTRNDELLWRIVRAHWDRPRFKRIAAAYRDKYKKPLIDRVHSETSSHFQHVLEAILQSTTRPYPVPTSADDARLELLRTRSRSSSVSSSFSNRSARSEEQEEQESAVLEADGELEQPPSPRSPPPPPMDEDEDDGLETPLGPNFSFGTSSSDSQQPSSPPLPGSSSLPNLNSSTSSTSSSTSSTSQDSHHKHSNSLSFRQRSSPLDPIPLGSGAGHKPQSSASGSGGGGASKLRHSRPVAPARNRRASGDPRPASTEPEGIQRSGSISPLMERSHSPEENERPDSSDGRRSSTSGIPRPLSRTNSYPLQSTTTTTNRRRESSDSSSTDSLGQQHAPSPIPLSSPPSSVSSPDLTSQSHSQSPPSSIDTTSYHPPPISPVGDVGPESSPFGYGEATPERQFFLRRETSVSSNNSRPGSMYVGEGFGAEGEGGGGYRPLSIVGGGGSGDQMKNALRQIQDLSRKLKDSEERYQQTSSTFEEEHAELESRLDDARSDLLAKVRENKELRNSEKAHMDSIVSLEADVAKLTKQAERNREQYELMKRNYQDQCTEAEKLRTLVAETRRENRMQEEAAHNHGLQVQQFERDRELLQQAITKLEEDLGVARRAQDHLDDQKQENLLLKETIDRLRFDMDELRGAGRKSVYVDGSGGASADSSVAGSLSRTLGAEIGRQQRERESSEEADEADSDEEINDIVVTTHRRVKKRATKPIGGGPASPSITRVEETTIVCDADTQTERVRTTSMDIQTDLAAVTVELVAAPAVEPLVVVPPKSPYEVQEELASGLGIELAQLQDFISGRKKQANSTAPPQPQQPQSTSRSSSATEAIMSSRRYGRWGSRLSRVGQAPSYIIGAFPPAARPFVSQVLDTSTAFCLYSVCLYLAGVVSGGLLFPLTHQHHMGPFHVLVSPGDRAQWHQYNTFGSSWGEGLSTGGANAHGAGATWSYWLQEVIWGGVSVARRFPS